MHEEIFAALPGALLPWFDRGHRDLPWRQDREPYHVWLSEIMLQQTRVEAVRGYYLRFLEALPSLETLAACDDEKLHKLWEGLGYYSRVRNLKKTAQILVETQNGQFPRSYEALLRLPGIGAYTAGAICSICFDLPTPAVDGNVLRVVSRLTEDQTPIDLPAYKAAVAAQLEQIYPSQAGKFTQALMELGATLCGPNRPPECEKCPCCGFCLGGKHGTAEDFPKKSPKKDRRVEEKTVLILSCGDALALEKRPEQGLLAGLWQFPNVPGKLEPEQALAQAEKWGLRPRDLLRQVERQHIFTHIRWELRGYYIEVTQPDGPFSWLNQDQLRQDAALPTAFRQFLEE